MSHYDHILTEERFLAEVACHHLEVRHEHGLYRHLVFKRPGSNAYRFDLVTWPGHLSYSGDMGAFTFSRLADMCTFFRWDGGPNKPLGDQINPQYWSEKLVAIDKGGYERFSPELFGRNIRERLTEWLESYPLDAEDRQELEQSVADDILSRSHDGEGVALHAAMDFIWRHGGKTRVPFEGFYEYSCNEYDYRYLWCCFALVWGISQYDDKKGTHDAANG